MPTREEVIEQTKKTRRILMDSALELTAESGFASVSLRSVARKTGIAATSFYRHFRDMDELGVELVMEVETLLNAYMSQLRETAGDMITKASPDDIAGIDLLVARAVDSFLKSVESNWNLFLFFFQAYTGSSEKIKRAAFTLLARLEADFSMYLKDAFHSDRLSVERMTAIAETLVLFLLHGGIHMIGRKKELRDIQEQIHLQSKYYLRGALSTVGND